MKIWNSGQPVTDGGMASGEAATKRAREETYMAAQAEMRGRIVKQELVEIHELARSARALTIDPAAAEALEQIEARSREALKFAYGMKEHQERIALKNAVNDQATVITWGGQQRSLHR